tara:strand:- start:555 stop:971 length:417 start_codon:yes stop_codon:yes gene_type:complete
MDKKSNISISQIKVEVGKELGLSLNRNTRKREYVYARAIYFKLCREFSHATLSSIGESVNRDHASVIHGMFVFDVIALHKDTILSSYTKIRNELLMQNEDDLKKYNEENYYKIKYNKLIEEYQELQKKYDLINETQEV